jgi:hypothetical protein
MLGQERHRDRPKGFWLSIIRAFLRGLRHIQTEPVWGGREDTAHVLRAACCAALPQCADLTRDEVLRHL